MTRKECPNCGNDSTEFIQFGGEYSDTTAVSEEQVGENLLELRYCNDCHAGIENVLGVVHRQVVTRD